MLVHAVERNVTFGDGGDPACVAARLRGLHGDLRERSDRDLLDGDLGR